MHIKNFDPYDFSKKNIGGVDVYYKNLPWSPCIHIQVVIDAGAFSDPVGKEGVAHFLEHVVGNGSPLLPDKKSIKEFNRLYMLDSKNAFTSHYRTAYVGKCLPNNFGKVLEAMRDYVFNPFIRVEDVEHERKVITEEAWGRYKNEKFLNYVKEFSQNMFPDHLRNRISSPLGWPETVSKISREDIEEFHKKYYVKDNLSIFIVGAIEEKDLELLEVFMKGIPSGQKNTINSGQITKPKKLKIEKNSEEIGSPNKQLVYTLVRPLRKMSYREVTVLYQLDYFLYDLLFERLRTENSLCYGVSVDISNFRDYSQLTISMKTNEENLQKTENEISNIISEIAEDKWKERFKTMHLLMIDQIKSAERLSGDVIQKASENIVVFDQIKSLESILEEEGKVTYEDIKTLVKEIFDSEWIINEVIYPSK